MNSTCDSDENVVLTVKNLDIVYKVPLYPAMNLRDEFISLCSHPIDYFFQEDDSFYVLKKFSMTLKQGERLGLLGVNGTGKTSLCRHISGMFGKNQHIQMKGKVRAIFDTSLGVEMELSGRENAYLLSLLVFPDLSKQERKNLIADALNFSELGHFIDMPFKHYSRGMKTRLFLSVISSAPTDLLVLDEVFDGADYFFNEKLANRVMGMIEKSGAVIFVSHAVEQIKKVCNRVIVLHGHQAAFDGPVDEGINFYLNYCNPQKTKSLADEIS